MAKKATPFFAHDCDRCVYIGKVPFSFADLYVCHRKDNDHDVVVRYGNDGAAYSSSTISLLAGRLAPEDFSGYIHEGKAYCLSCGRYEMERLRDITLDGKIVARCATCNRLLTDVRYEAKADA